MLNVGGATHFLIEWSNPENYTSNTTLLSNVNSSDFAKMATAEELLEEILRATIEFVLAGDGGGDPVTANEATDNKEKVGRRS